jgi:hypothetical protein
VPPGRPAGELGALFDAPTGDCRPLWLDGAGRVIFERESLPASRPSFRDALRWTSEPLTWGDLGRPLPRMRASARRAYESARVLAVTPRGQQGNRRPTSHDRQPPAEPAGYLLRSPTNCTVEFHAAVHPVTRDQLLSTDPSEAARLGYGEPKLLGYLIARAPVTGALGPMRPGTPWAARFGADVDRR